MSRTLVIAAAALIFLAAACQTRHEVRMEPVEVKPIHITIDVNVRVDRALDNFFDDLDRAEKTIEPASTDE